jgi:hypothetical protein
LCLSSTALAKQGENRAIWLSFPYWDLNSSEKNIVVDALADSGVNTVYLAVYGSAKARWESKALEGLEIAKIGTKSIFKEGVEIIRNAGMRVVPWFEAGLSVYLSQSFPSKNKELLQKCGKGYASGEYGGKVMGFLDPKNATSLKIVTEALKELATHPLNFDEIQLDRFRYTRGKYKRICKSFDGSSDPHNIDVAVKKAYEAIKKANPLVKVSASPVTSIGGKYYHQNWHTWAQGGYIDAISGQAYTKPINLSACAKGSKNGLSRKTSLFLFKKEFSAWKKKLDKLEAGFPLTIGLMAERNDDSECVVDQIRYARSQGINDFSLWVSKIKPESDGSSNPHIRGVLELLKETNWGKK